MNGSMDIVIGNSKEPNKVFLNFKNGNSWEEITLRKDSLATYDIILGDLNNDKRLDIIESNSDDINHFYLNLLRKKK
jgi:hypothetical protein